MPEILTKRLALTPYLYPTTELLRIHTFWLADKEVTKYSEHRHERVPWQHSKKYIMSFDHQRNHIWAILDKTVKRHVHEPWEDHYMGHITAHCDPFNKTARVGILIGEKRFWKQGYGTETWQAACHWLIENGARKVCAGCMEPNEPMRRIFSKTGMQEEGRLKAQFLFDGNPVDMIQAARFA